MADAFAEVYRRILPGSLASREWTTGSDGYSAVYANVADGIRGVGAFGEPEQWRFGWERSYTRDEWLDQIPTSGVASRFPPATLAEVLAGIGAAIDAMGGGFTMPYTAVVVTAARTDAA